MERKPEPRVSRGRPRTEANTLEAELEAIGWALLPAPEGVYHAKKQETDEAGSSRRWRDAFADTPSGLLAQAIANNKRIQREHAGHVRSIRASIGFTYDELEFEQEENDQREKRKTKESPTKKRLIGHRRRPASPVYTARIRAAIQRNQIESMVAVQSVADEVWEALPEPERELLLSRNSDVARCDELLNLLVPRAVDCIRAGRELRNDATTRDLLNTASKKWNRITNLQQGKAKADAERRLRLELKVVNSVRDGVKIESIIAEHSAWGKDAREAALARGADHRTAEAEKRKAGWSRAQILRVITQARVQGKLPPKGRVKN